MPCAVLGAEALREELAALTREPSRAFNVNFFCHEMPPRDEARGPSGHGARWAHGGREFIGFLEPFAEDKRFDGGK